MPTSGDEAPVLLDTSAAVALVVEDHDQHGATARRLAGHQLGLAGHAAFETFSVLTRLPPPARRSPTVVGRILASSFPATRFLSADAAADLLSLLGRGGMAGGSVYDALVGATALEHGLPLASLDRRAQSTYQLLGVEVLLIA